MLSPFLIGRTFALQNIVWGIRRTILCFLIELTVRRTWFRQFGLNLRKCTNDMIQNNHSHVGPRFWRPCAGYCPQWGSARTLKEKGNVATCHEKTGVWCLPFTGAGTGWAVSCCYSVHTVHVITVTCICRSLSEWMLILLMSSYT